MRTRWCKILSAVVVGFVLVGTSARAADEPKKDPLGLKAAYKGGFQLTTENKKFSMRIFSALQFRYTYMAYDDMVKGNEENYSNFFIRRARLWWDGNAFDPNFTYYFHLQLEPMSAVNLHDAWVQYKFSDTFSIGLGRNKIPYGTEFLNSGFGLNFIDRSIMYGETDIQAGGGLSKWPGGNQTFAISGEQANTGFPVGGFCLFRSQGVSASGMKTFKNGGAFQYEAGVWQGRNTKGGSNLADDHLFAVRMGYYPFGWINWLFQGDPDYTEKLKIGFLLSAYTDESMRSKDAAGATVALYSPKDSGYNVSILLKYRGFSTDVEWGTETYDLNRTIATGPVEFDREAFRASFGYFVVPTRVEVVARYSEVQRLKDPTADAVKNSGLGFVKVWNGTAYVDGMEDKLTEITAGVNFYIGAQKHQHKLFFDVSLLGRTYGTYQSFTPEDQEDTRFRSMLQFKF